MDDYVHEEGGEDNTIWEDDLGSGGWEPIDFASNPVKVSFNKVDEMLLKTLREEAKVIADRVRQILGVPNGRKMRSVPLQRLFNLWFSPDLVHTILLRVNKSFIVEDQVSAAELYAFMQVEMYLSAYNTFPSKFFRIRCVIQKLGNVYLKHGIKPYLLQCRNHRISCPQE